MTVYLDDWRQPARLGPVDDRWSHLVADSEGELHAFAAALGMRREWFQQRPGRPHHDHYDLPERLRSDALALGAVPVTWRDLARLLRARRPPAPVSAPVSARVSASAPTLVTAPRFR